MALSPETDRYHLVYFTLLALGMTMLFPWNAFISAPHYVKSYYRYASGDPNLNATMPKIWENIENYIAICTMAPNQLGQMMLLTKAGRRLSKHNRMMYAGFVIVLTMAAVPLGPAFKPSEKGALVILLTAVTLCGFATAFLQATVFSLAAYFPPHFTQATMLGIGVAGSSVALLSVITKASMEDSYNNHQIESRIYFGISTGCVLIALLMLWFLKRNPFAKRYVTEYRDKDTDGDFDYLSPVSSLAGSGTFEEKVETVETVFKCVYPLFFANLFVFLVTLTVFPGLGVAIRGNDAWFGIIIILMFNLGDATGRFSCKIEKLWLPRKVLPYLSALRVLFIPLFFFCVSPKWITNTEIPMLIMFLTGVTNGFVGSQCMMFAPVHAELTSDHDLSVAGALMSLSLLTGCSLGSLFALLVGLLIPHN